MADLSDALKSLISEVPDTPVLGARAPAGPRDEPSPTASAFSPALAFDLALGIDTPRDVAQRHGLTETELTEIQQHEQFKKLLATFEEQLAEHGVSFRTKAALHAEVMLDTVMWNLMKDPMTPSATKLDIFKTLAKLAGYEPKQVVDPGTGNSFKLVINLGNDQSAERVIRAEPLIIDQEDVC